MNNIPAVASGLTVRTASNDQVQAIVAAVVGTSAQFPPSTRGLRYLYAAYQHGYDVAHQKDGRWTWGSAVYANCGPGYPAAGPEHGLEEVRLFDTDSELLLTRIAGNWHGWWRSAAPETDEPWLHSRPRSYLVTTGTGVSTTDGFSRIEHISGQFSVLPHAFPRDTQGYAHTREYFTPGEHGAVRVAAVTWTGYGTRSHRPVRERQ